MSELLSVEEVARALRVHELTVRRYIKRGKLAAVRIGGRIRVRKEDVERFARPIHPNANPLVLDLGPVSDAEIARRHALFAEAMRLREEIGPIGVAADELVRQARAEAEDRGA